MALELKKTTQNNKKKPTTKPKQQTNYDSQKSFGVLLAKGMSLSAVHTHTL